MQAISDHVRGLPHDHPRRHVSMQFDEVSILSGVQYRPGNGDLVGFVSRTPFAVHALASGDVEPEPTTERKTAQGLIAEQKDRLAEGVATHARVVLIASSDGGMAQHASTQFLSASGTARPQDNATVLLHGITDLATIDVHVHAIVGDNHICNTVRDGHLHKRNGASSPILT